MKLFRALTMMIGLGFALSAGAATLTTDPLTGLPLDPATDSRHLGNEPIRMHDSQICKSKMQGEFYSGVDSKVDATVAWYAAHLAGFHKAHAYAGGRSQDSFYNDTGTLVVFVTGRVTAHPPAGARCRIQSEWTCGSCPMLPPTSMSMSSRRGRPLLFEIQMVVSTLPTSVSLCEL